MHACVKDAFLTDSGNTDFFAIKEDSKRNHCGRRIYSVEWLTQGECLLMATPFHCWIASCPTLSVGYCFLCSWGELGWISCFFESGREKGRPMTHAPVSVPAISPPVVRLACFAGVEPNAPTPPGCYDSSRWDADDPMPLRSQTPPRFPGGLPVISCMAGTPSGVPFHGRRLSGSVRFARPPATG